MIATSYLRVYQPASVFSTEEQAHWLRERSEIDRSEHSAARRWLISTSLPSDPVLAPGEGAFVRKYDGQVLVCPWRTRLRMLAGLIAFRGSVPEEVAEAFVPEESARDAAHALAQLDEDHPEVRSHILHANWHVPLRWFAAFDDSERILTEDKDGLRVRYEAQLSTAAARLEQALGILEGSWIDSGVTDAVRELLEWLAGFPEDGLIELDYASVAQIFSHDELLEDHSAAEVWVCLDSLAAGDVVRAGSVFGTLTDRWTEARAHEVVN
ncbi:MAG: hypothetical protein LC749_09080 [Actinobacteria bacterium]|nr:hypothetical protein [Actinomycetota bacterium]